MRLLKLPIESWKLLSTRIQAKLSQAEVDRFATAQRVYTTKDRVNEYNYNRLVIQIGFKNVGLAQQPPLTTWLGTSPGSSLSVSVRAWCSRPTSARRLSGATTHVVWYMTLAGLLVQTQ